MVGTRHLGRSGIEVSALGVGCWTIGGPFNRRGDGLGWGPVDDRESLRALDAAFDAGVTFYDTSDVYGCGHSERVLGRALKGRRDRVVVATKFGNVFDEATRTVTGTDLSPAGVAASCEASLARLGVEVIDVYQLHVPSIPREQVADVVETLERLVDRGKIRCYGWSTVDAEAAAAFAAGPHCALLQHPFSLFDVRLDLVRLCEATGVASVNRSPLAMGILSGKYRDRAASFGPEDIRRSWDLRDGERGVMAARAEALRDVLTRDGRTVAQAALAWIWAKSDATIPIPGFRTAAQVRENTGALALGPLAPDHVAAIDAELTATSILVEG